MKISCDLCSKIEDIDRLKGWALLRTGYSEFRLCPKCASGSLVAESNIGPVVLQEEQS